MPRPARRSRKTADLKSTWTRDDERLSGMPDPLKPTTDGPSDEIVAMWEKSFMTAIANDREYWRDRSARLAHAEPQAEVWPIDSDRITNVLAQAYEPRWMKGLFAWMQSIEVCAHGIPSKLSVIAQGCLRRTLTVILVSIVRF